MYYLYHYEHPHKEGLEYGYIGITNDLSLRHNKHKYDQRKGKSSTLYKAASKYGWENLKRKVLCIGSKEYICELERLLRPERGIGWNCAIGGGEPPVMLGELNPFYGRTHTQETKERISKTKKSQGTGFLYTTPKGEYKSLRQAAQANNIGCHKTVKRWCIENKDGDWSVRFG